MILVGTECACEVQFAISELNMNGQAFSVSVDCWPRGYKTFFVLNSVEHEILNAHKYKKYQEIRLFLGSAKHRMLFFPLINVKMPTIVGILTFMSREIFMLI